MTQMTLQAVRQLIANDSYAITFQSVEQYRATLLRHVDSLVEGTQRYASGGTVPAELHLVGEGARPLSTPAAQQAAAPCALLAILRDVHDTLASESDSDLDHFEDDEEEREGAPVQYAARKVMEVMDMLKAAPSALGTPEAPAKLMQALTTGFPLYEPVYIAKALRAQREARVSLAGGAGPGAAVFLVNIQMTPWTHTKETAEAYAEGYNRALKDYRAALLDVAAQHDCGHGEE